MSMTLEEAKAFEQWLLQAYKNDPTVPFPVLAQALKAIRTNVR